jgi:PIN domain nuclease of toxin-antitoxin system
MNLLLDSHAFIWLDGDRQKLSPAAAHACADIENTLWVSVVSLWEIQIKMQMGKLKLRGSMPDILREQSEINGLQILSLQPAHALGLAGLPLHHNDPFDRMLVVQARLEGLDIVTKDPEFNTYPVRVIW